uniref:Integrase core domain-containing protein n=1 Tax=Cyprinus carpio TaxID=7962 RepID=A0A8C1QS23_CYPCA
MDAILDRLHSRLSHLLNQPPIDLDFLEFTCTQELVFLNALSSQENFPHAVMEGLREVIQIIGEINHSQQCTHNTVNFESGKVGRPRVLLPEERLRDLIAMSLPVPCIAKLLGVSTRTIQRRMSEIGLAVRDTYSSVLDEELDALVSTVKSRHPYAGYRMMKGLLQAMGHRVQWERIRASMHRVDSAGIISRLTQLGCVVRRTYSVPSPGALMHIDTNHKLIRYNIVIFGGIDGFSRKVCKHILLPNFLKMSGIERLWRDIWVAVTNIYYNVLHQLEEEGQLDMSNRMHLFCCHYVFIPRLQAHLDTFHDGWDNHPLSTEGNLTPNQLWELGGHQVLSLPENEVLYVICYSQFCYCLLND